MKVKHNFLKGTAIVTSFGEFKLDKDGIADIPDESAKKLVNDNIFKAVAAATKTPEASAEKTPVANAPEGKGNAEGKGGKDNKDNAPAK